jgi:serine/threonine protein kinase
MAPEVFNKDRYSKSIDVWSIGVTLYKLICGRHPLHRKGECMSIFKDKLETQEPFEFGPEFSELSKDFISHMAQYRSMDRYTVDQALKHPWITR